MEIVVVGGGAAGMSAASKAKRVNPSVNVTVIEKGRYVSYAECGIPYFLEGIVKTPEELLHYPVEEFTKKRGINVRTGTGVVEIRRKEHSLVLSDGSIMQYDKLILALGAVPKIPEQFASLGIPGIRSLESGEQVRSMLEGSRKVAIVGDGVLGLEIAASLKQSGKSVTLVSRHSEILRLLDSKVGEEFRHDFMSHVDVLLNAGDLSIQKKGEGYMLRSHGYEVPADMVISATGVQPNTGLAEKSGIALHETGAILVNKSMLSSDPDIYAVGDCSTTTNVITGKPDWHPLAQVSNKMGRVAGSNAAGYEAIFPGSLGTVLVKIFDYEIGYTGLNESSARKLGIPARTVFVKAMSRAGYYPGKQPVYLNLVIDTDSGKVLGAQAVSKDGGAWRINTIAAAIQAGMKAEDLYFADLGYSPPFGPVWDPIIIAADIAMK